MFVNKCVSKGKLARVRTANLEGMHLEQNQEQRGYLVLSSKELVDQLSNADLQCDTALQPTKKDKNL